MITIETTARSARVTIPTDEMPPERLRLFLDWLRLEAIAQRSQLSEVEADQMAEAVKAEWWATNKTRLTNPETE